MAKPSFSRIFFNLTHNASDENMISIFTFYRPHLILTSPHTLVYHHLMTFSSMSAHRYTAGLGSPSSLFATFLITRRCLMLDTYFCSKQNVAKNKMQTT